MPNSMTAFACQQIQAEWGSLLCEIRSVNHRYLELSFRMPEQLREIEMLLRDLARNIIKRGKVEISFRLQLETNQLPDIQVNNTVLDKVIASAERVSAKLQRPSNLNAMQLLQWPGVLLQCDTDEATIQADAKKLLQATLTELLETRAREGNELQQYMQQRLITMTEQVAIVRTTMPDFLKQQRQRLVDKFSELNLQIDNERLEQEMIIYIQRADVEEELDRLETHITEVTRVLTPQEPIGRPLDL